jgi:hypothetical protein
MDDIYFWAPKTGKRGRGVPGKAKVMVTVETTAYKPRFAAKRLVPRVSREEIQVLDSKNSKEYVEQATGFCPRSHSNACGRLSGRLKTWGLLTQAVKSGLLHYQCFFYKDSS